jgi:tRNA-uridine 2-sulfurtransferase
MNKESNKKRVAVGMSGGVDSSVALMILKKRGYEPIGVSIKYAAWENKKNLLKENICCAKESFEIARKICRKFNVPYHILDYSQEFKDKVMGYFTALLKEKKTPNPCLICNQNLKFKKLFEFAKKQGADYVATGHYARKKFNTKTNQVELLRAKDKDKDQSYFLCLLNQRQLKNLIFPIGDYKKEQVYQIAKKHGFDFFLKTKQSQNLCFISPKSIPHYLEEEIGFEPGLIQDKEDYTLGEHQGLYFYTIGQRKRIGLSGGPWWVIDFNKKNNSLIVSHDPDDPALYRKTAMISDAHFLSKNKLNKPIKVKAKIRYAQNLAPATLYPGKKNHKLVFKKPQRAVTPGQWAVFYKREVCLGGGIII